MNSIGPIAQDLLELLRNPQPRVREIAARLAGHLDAAAVRPELQRLRANDAVPAVREAAQAALERMRPDGGRGNEIIARHGGYGGLKALQSAEIVYDATVAFCNRFIDRRSRTHDQMVQAARSGKQNIVEGSAAAGISSKTELRLIGVARASLEELLADYRDFLRQRNLPQWEKSDPRAQEIRQLAYSPNRSYETYRSYFEHSPPEAAANAAICIVCQTTYLLDRLIKQLTCHFVEEGGLSERMFKARLRHREKTQL